MTEAMRDADLRLRYRFAAERYHWNRRPKDDSTHTAQAEQRRITMDSLRLIHAVRSEVQVFSGLPVQYLEPDDGVGLIEPDNMVVIHPEPISTEGSFETVFQPVGPFWVLEYGARITTRRNGRSENLQAYERNLKVPYYLHYIPDTQDLALHYLRPGKQRFVQVPSDSHGRHPIPELELKVGIHEGWLRFWFRGELLPLPADLQRELVATRRELQQERAARMAAEAEVARLRAELARRR